MVIPTNGQAPTLSQSRNPRSGAVHINVSTTPPRMQNLHLGSDPHNSGSSVETLFHSFITISKRFAIPHLYTFIPRQYAHGNVSERVCASSPYTDSYERTPLCAFHASQPHPLYNHIRRSYLSPYPTNDTHTNCDYSYNRPSHPTMQERNQKPYTQPHNRPDERAQDQKLYRHCSTFTRHL